MSLRYPLSVKSSLPLYATLRTAQRGCVPRLYAAAFADAKLGS